LSVGQELNIKASDEHASAAVEVCKGFEVAVEVRDTGARSMPPDEVRKCLRELPTNVEVVA
jgi:hypothetical protein